MRRYDYELMSSEDVDRVLRRGAVSIESALKVARPIIEAVRAGGDRALLAYARKYEGFTGSTTLVPSEELQAASARLAPALIKSLKLSAKRIQAYHKRQRLGAFESARRSYRLRGWAFTSLEGRRHTHLRF
jgi:histidinol dehydrogenase